MAAFDSCTVQRLPAMSGSRIPTRQGRALSPFPMVATSPASSIMAEVTFRFRIKLMALSAAYSLASPPRSISMPEVGKCRLDPCHSICSQPTSARVDSIWAGSAAPSARKSHACLSGPEVISNRPPEASHSRPARPSNAWVSGSTSVKTPLPARWLMTLTMLVTR